jgi:predicted house-cleaning noncanonical NTP pyrophosphatase (MazG superfamily)
MMRTFLQNKLWRDKMIDIMEQHYGSKITWRTLNNEEFDQQLRIKLLEETHEAIATQSRDDLIAELADVHEVIDCLIAVHNITKKEIVTAQIKKQTERGSFMERKFVETAQHPVGSYGEHYCLADPEKYPEII